jgi:hypothetical protein
MNKSKELELVFTRQEIATLKEAMHYYIGDVLKVGFKADDDLKELYVIEDKLREALK